MPSGEGPWGLLVWESGFPSTEQGHFAGQTATGYRKAKLEVVCLLASMEQKVQGISPTRISSVFQGMGWQVMEQ
jgi:hypothetical protein